MGFLRALKMCRMRTSSVKTANGTCGERDRTLQGADGGIPAPQKCAELAHKLSAKRTLGLRVASEMEYFNGGEHVVRNSLLRPVILVSILCCIGYAKLLEWPAR